MPESQLTTVKLPKNLHRKLKNFAFKAESTMTEVIITSLQSYFRSLEKGEERLKKTGNI